MTMAPITLRGLLSKWRKPLIAAFFSVNLCLAVYSCAALYAFPPSSRNELATHDYEDLGNGDDHDMVAMDFLRRGVRFKPHQTKFDRMLLPSSVSCNDDTFLFVGVCSAYSNIKLRHAIRETWGQYIAKSDSSLLVFLIGKPSPSEEQFMEAVHNESSLYGDILQESYVDHYSNLSLKTLSLLQWAASECPSAKFVMKTDDDIFINVPLLLQELSKTVSSGQSKIALGHMIKHAEPISDRFSKWFTPASIYRKKAYPDYLSGCAYVLSNSLVPEILGKSSMHELFWLEDVYITGMLVPSAGGTLVHNKLFGYHKRKKDPCILSHVITSHEVTAYEMNEAWRELHKPITAFKC